MHLILHSSTKALIRMSIFAPPKKGATTFLSLMGRGIILLKSMSVTDKLCEHTELNEH